MYTSVSKGQRCSRLNLTVSQSFLNSECRLYSRQNLKALLATSLYRTSKVLLLRTRSRMLRKASQRKRNHGVSTTLSVRDCVSSPLTVLRRRLHVRKGSGRGATIKCGKTPTTPRGFSHRRHQSKVLKHHTFQQLLAPFISGMYTSLAF